MLEDWRRRFTTPTIADFIWGTEAPDRLGVVSNEDGSTQAWTWDLATGERRLASTGGVGAEEVHVLPDGSGVLWWLDELGDEHGRWMLTPSEGESTAVLPELPDAWMMGISLVAGAAAFGFSTAEDYVIYTRHGDEAPVERYRHRMPAGVGSEWPQGGGGLSADASLLCIRHAEDGDIAHQALRIIDARTGATVADQRDPGAFMGPVAWSPVPGDQRLLIHHERPGIDRPAVWNAAAGERTDLPFEGFSGPITPLGWAPGGTGLLLHHQTTGVQQLLAHDPGTGVTTTLVDVEGTISPAAYRPDGDLWYRVHTSTAPPSIRNLADDVVLALPGPEAPAGRPFRVIRFANRHGQHITGFVVTPEGTGPFPTVLSIHGGPEWHHTDGWDPTTQAFVDHGYAVVMVNYRGSTGYGREHREALHGNIGFPESEDIIAALDHVIAEGIADPARVAIEGWSWGGYLANLNAGINPDRWRAVIAGIPAGDYVAAHYESAPALQAWDRAVMGGSPMDLPDLYHERNPMTYVDRVSAPTLMIAGEHDSRCPLGQVMVYAHALKLRGKEVQVHLYPGGHHAGAAAERILHVELMLKFLRRHLGG